MNVYDFDGTIYDGDSTVDFFLFALKSKPSLIRCIPKQMLGFALYSMKQISKTELKEYFFSFLSLADADRLLVPFWQHNRHKIYDWYLLQQQPDDIVISASPEFLLNPICEQLGIGCLIASKVDVHSGKFEGENCREQEKVRRLAEERQITCIDRFYSDSHSDLPLARIAEHAFLVTHGEISEWKVTE